MRPNEAEEAKLMATRAADYLRKNITHGRPVKTAVILGTGWGDAVQLHEAYSASLSDIPGFDQLPVLAGHRRNIVCGLLNGTNTPVLLLRGRVHLNESPSDPAVVRHVRLQVEMLALLGIENFILTCAAGSLRDDLLCVGDMVVINDFLSVAAPPMPLFAGEFCSPHQAMSGKLQAVADEMVVHYNGKTTHGAYVMIRGPQFDSPLDKRLFAAAGALVVGMSMYPETCVASLYPHVRVLALAFVSNNMTDPHSHANNLLTADNHGERLSAYTEALINRIAQLEK